MKYILNKNAALREWNDNRYPYALIIRKNPKPLRLTKKEFDFIKLADGQHEFTEELIASQSFKKALGMHLIQEAKEGDALSDWQKYHYYDNPHFNSISLRLTGRCNMNCKHCFNAADVNTDNSQWTFDEAKKLIDDAAECGIRMFRITGGEPMLHPDFIKVVQYIKEKGMVPRDILTNGAFITQEILDEIKKVNKHATFVISFDCLHHHDWMRGKEGSEKKAIDAIKLCVDNGFNVFLNVQANRITRDTLVETAEFFDSIGVQTFRFIRTTETPRWKELAGDAILSYEEYYDTAVDFLKKYYAKEHKMEIIVWQFGWFNSNQKYYKFVASRSDVSKYRDDIYSCSLSAETISLGSNGLIYPCHQVSGVFDALGWKLPNVKEVGLKAGMKDREVLRDTRFTWGQVAKENETCRNCLHFKQCGGGCRSCALCLDKNYMGVDPYMCNFYKGNYYEKVAAVLPGWRVKHKPIESHYGEEDLIESACEMF